MLCAAVCYGTSSGLHYERAHGLLAEPDPHMVETLGKDDATTLAQVND